MTHSSVKRVVVCADDFGLTMAACRSIIKLTQTNAISAASCAVDGPYCRLHADELLGAAPLSLGLHLNLTENRNDPRFVSLHSWILRCFVMRRADRRWIEQTITKQLDSFETIFKRAPDFIDGHEHVHQFPIIRDALFEVLSRRYVSTIAVRSTQSRISRGHKAAVIALLGGRALRAALSARNIATNSDFAGVYDFSTRIPFEQRMRAWLTSIEDRGLIMCHPELSASAVSARDGEHALLNSTAWRELLRECNAQLIAFNTTTLAA